MKYFTYISESKIEMLHSQLSKIAQKKTEFLAGLNLKLFQLQLKSETSKSVSIYDKLQKVLDELDRLNLIGDIESPKEYIKGTLEMKWASYGTHGWDESTKHYISFWGYNSKSHCLALAGSFHNLIGQPKTIGSVNSSSGTGVIMDWLKNKIDHPANSEYLVDGYMRIVNSDGSAYVPGGDEVANSIHHAVGDNMRGASVKVEFVAKVLSTGSSYRGWHNQETKVIVASPIYVAEISSLI